MLLIPLVVGAAVARVWGLQGPLFLLTCLAIYVSRQPLSLLFKRWGRAEGVGKPLFWTLAYWALATAFGLPLLYAYGRWLLLPWAALFLAFSGVHLYLRAQGLVRTATAELLTISGLALTAPGAYYVASGSFDVNAFSLWLLTSLYSGSSVFYVRLKMRQRALRREPLGLGERWRMGQASLFYQALLVATLVASVMAGWVPPLVPLAFLPLLTKVGHALLTSGPEVNIKRVGWLEVAHSLLFTALLIATYLIALPF
jgi:hypothetical protein